MANEKTLLQKELDRFRRRQKEILVRLAELATKEGRLMALVQGAGFAVALTTPEPGIDASVARRVKVKEFSY